MRKLSVHPKIDKGQFNRIFCWETSDSSRLGLCKMRWFLPERCTHSRLAKLLTNGYCCWRRVICALFWDSPLVSLASDGIEWGLSDSDRKRKYFRIFLQSWRNLRLWQKKEWSPNKFQKWRFLHNWSVTSKLKGIPSYDGSRGGEN